MCSNSVRCLVEDTVKEFVDKGCDTFTAYDITIAARKKTKEHFYHSEVKNVVHMTMSGQYKSQYGRRQHSLQPAWEYYSLPTVTDDDDTGSVCVNNVVSYSVPDVAPVSKQDGHTFSKDARGTYAVRSSLLTQVGIKPGDKVHVFPVMGGLSVYKFNYTDISKSITDATQYTVDRYGNVRITKSAFNSEMRSSPILTSVVRDDRKSVLVRMPV